MVSYLQILRYHGRDVDGDILHSAVGYEGKIGEQLIQSSNTDGNVDVIVVRAGCRRCERFESMLEMMVDLEGMRTPVYRVELNHMVVDPLSTLTHFDLQEQRALKRYASRLIDIDVPMLLKFRHGVLVEVIDVPGV